MGDKQPDLIQERPWQDGTEGVVVKGSWNVLRDNHVPVGGGSGFRGRCQVQMGLFQVACACGFRHHAGNVATSLSIGKVAWKTRRNLLLLVFCFEGGEDSPG